MKIRTRIISLVAIILTLMVVAAAFAIREMRKIGNEIEEIAHKDIPLSGVAGRISQYKSEQSVNFERALRFATESDSGEFYIDIPFQEAKAEFLRLNTLIEKTIEDGKGIIRRARALYISPNVRKEIEFADEQLRQIEKSYLTYVSHVEEILNLLEHNQKQDAEIESLTLLGEEEELKEALETLLTEIDRITRSSSLRAEYVQRNARHGMGIVFTIATVLGVTLALIITRSITKPLSDAVDIAEKVASGNKEIKIETNYQSELGQLLLALKNMLESLNASEEALKERANELARSNAELEQFAYVASHDLQEPLRMVASYTQLIGKRYSGQLDDTADEFIAFAVDGVNRMQRLINDLLSYSRVGRKEIVFDTVDISNVFAQTLVNLQAKIEETGTKITHDNFPVIQGDETQLIQLFQNLVGNAIKFCNQNTPQVHVATQKNGKNWIFSISDNGIGIDSEYKDRIFNIFQRLHTRDEYPGTGIGLAICKKIVERHSGEIWVDSKTGEGATFSFTIPVSGETMNG